MMRKDLTKRKLTHKELKDLEELVYNYPTKNKEGFIHEEQLQLIEKFPTINLDKYYDAMHGNTCVMNEGKLVSYHCDVLQALICGLESRDMYNYEWD